MQRQIILLCIFVVGLQVDIVVTNHKKSTVHEGCSLVSDAAQTVSLMFLISAASDC